MKLCLESRIQKVIPVGRALMQWLLGHVCLLLNTAVRGPDGLTAWSRARGRPFRQVMFYFGENVLYKYPTKGPKSQPDGNMGSLGGEGVFLGYNRSSNTYAVHGEKGLCTYDRPCAAPSPSGGLQRRSQG